jgi:hypothetical protein
LTQNQQPLPLNQSGGGEHQINSTIWQTDLKKNTTNLQCLSFTATAMYQVYLYYQSAVVVGFCLYQ